MQFKSQNAAQFAFWNKNFRMCLGHKVPISLKKSEKWKILLKMQILINIQPNSITLSVTNLWPKYSSVKISSHHS